MLMAYEYLDICVDIMSEVCSSGLELYPNISHNDDTGSTKLASIGTLDRSIDKTPICIKYQSNHGTLGVHNRMRQELHVASLIYDRVPLLRHRLPLFIGQISVNDRVIAVVTEDATNNGSDAIWPTDVSEEDMGLLLEAFPDDPEFGPAFTGKIRSLAFNVGGRDRWLDFTPNPFNEMYLDRISHREAVYDRVEDLTWKIDSIEELGIFDAHSAGK